MIQTFDTLYARDSKGKILKWNIELQNNNNSIDIKISYGEYNGAQAIRWQRNIQGKNIGKSNETNSWEQAILQIESKIRLQKKKGYITLDEAQQAYLSVDTVVIKASHTFRHITESTKDTLLIALDQYLPKNRTDASGDIKPMKAQQYYRSKKNWIDPYGELWGDRKYFYLTNPYKIKEKGAIITKFPCMAQPKINGVRATIKLVDNTVIIKSKEGKIYRVAHIEDFLNINNDIFSLDDKELILDGELYIHNELLQDIGSAINKPNLNTSRLVFILFDIAIEEESNVSRHYIIKNYIKPKLDVHLKCPIEVIRTVICKTDNQAQLFTDTCIDAGYEGAIFRQPAALYAFGKRPQSMTKLKRTISSEFKIIDIVPQEKDATKGNFVCVTKQGLRFEVNPKGTDIFKREVLRERSKFIGKDLQCSFYEWTKDLKPFHIIENTVRDYE